MDRFDLLTTLEVAERLGVSIRTVHRMVDDGRLEPAGKLPGPTGAYLFTAGSVKAAVK